MVSRKLLAAFFTALLCYFIVPLFFHDFAESYFVIGLGVSIIAVPILFTVGILSSIAIEQLSKKEHALFSLAKHFGCGIIFTVIFLLLSGEIRAVYIYLSIASVYIIIFYISDLFIKLKRSNW